MDIPQAMAEYQFKSTIHVIHYYAALQKKKGGGIFNTFNIQWHIMNTSSIFKFTYYFVHRAEKRCILKSLTSNKSCLSKVLGMRIILSLFPNQYPPSPQTSWRERGQEIIEVTDLSKNLITVLYKITKFVPLKCCFSYVGYNNFTLWMQGFYTYM